VFFGNLSEREKIDKEGMKERIKQAILVQAIDLTLTDLKGLSRAVK